MSTKYSGTPEGEMIRLLEGIERTLKSTAITKKEINSIRTQPIPKDCEGAINYGIKMKGDLQWPKAD